MAPTTLKILIESSSVRPVKMALADALVASCARLRAETTRLSTSVHLRTTKLEEGIVGVDGISNQAVNR